LSQHGALGLRGKVDDLLAEHHPPLPILRRRSWVGASDPPVTASIVIASPGPPHAGRHINAGAIQELRNRRRLPPVGGEHASAIISGWDRSVECPYMLCPGQRSRA